MEFSNESIGKLINEKERDEPTFCQKKLLDLQFCNTTGLIEPHEPFYIFDTIPSLRSYFIIGCSEWWDKRITEISIQIFWKKEDLPKDFSDYYAAYSFGYYNASVKVSFEILKNGIWKSLDKIPVRLFEENEKNKTVSETRTINLKFSDNLVFIGSLSLGKSHEYNGKSVEGFIKIELVGPDFAFGHELFPTIYTDFEIEKARREKSSSFWKFWRQKTKKPPPVLSLPYSPQVDKVDISMTYLRDQEI